MELGHIFPSRSANRLADVQPLGVFPLQNLQMPSIVILTDYALLCKLTFIWSLWKDFFYQILKYIKVAIIINS